MRNGIVLAVLCMSTASTLYSQDFQNLNFESADVSNLPPNHFEFVAASDGLPGWSAYIGTNQLTQIEHNGITLGFPNVAIRGPDYGLGPQPLEGAYTAILQPGGSSGGGFSASIAQTALIPELAESIRFLASLAYTNDLVVTVGGHGVQVVPLGSNAFGCDVSGFAGSVEELRFTIEDNHGNDLNSLDAITFSPESIPEPSTIKLLLVGVLLSILSLFPRATRRKA